MRYTSVVGSLVDYDKHQPLILGYFDARHDDWSVHERTKTCLFAQRT